MTRPDNPPAFPLSDSAMLSSNPASYGMSLRDWFAGQALGSGLVQGNMSEDDLCHHFGQRWHRREVTGEEIIALEAYLYADALLLARKEDGNG